MEGTFVFETVSDEEHVYYHEFQATQNTVYTLQVVFFVVVFVLPFFICWFYH